MKRRHGVLLCLAFSSALFCGCGSSDGLHRTGVAGVVTLDGTPLANGQIAFLPADGTPGPATGTDIIDGKFSIDPANGPAVGRHRVEIRSFQKTGKQISGGTDSESTSEIVDEIQQVVASQFNSQSELTADLTAESADDLRFQVSTAKGKSSAAASSRLP